MRFHRQHRRYFSILEVLIAFALVGLCVLPLISPHVAIFRKQKEFVSKIELDQAVANLYAALLERLYRNEVPWSVFENGQTIPIENDWWKEAGYISPLPFAGRAIFHIKKQKKEKEGSLSAILLEVFFSFTLTNEKKTVNGESPPEISYPYRVFIARELGGNVK